MEQGLNVGRLIYSKLMKVIGMGLLFSIFITLSIGCCAQIKKSNLQNSYIHKLEKKLKQSSEFPVISNNFIKLEVYMMGSNDDPCNVNSPPSDCKEKIYSLTTASGYIIKKDLMNNELYFVTAAHWCEELDWPDEFNRIFGRAPEDKPVTGYYSEFMGKEYPIEIIAQNSASDICLGKFKTNLASKASNVKIAEKPPLIGEKVYTQSAPMGIHNPLMRNNFEGRFSGCDNFTCSFTLPATFGSSGSAVINENGDIISIVSSAVIDFPHIVLGPTVDQLNAFLGKHLK